MRSVTALKMLQDGVGVGRLSFGCQLIDKCTRGGLPLQGINEIVGEAGRKNPVCANTVITVSFGEVHVWIGWLHSVYIVW